MGSGFEHTSASLALVNFHCHCWYSVGPIYYLVLRNSAKNGGILPWTQSYDSACQHPQDYCGHEIHIPIRKHGRQPVFRLSCSMIVTFTNCVTSPAKTMLPVSHLSTVHCVTPSERLCRIGLFLGGGREREREREWPALINWPRVTVNGSQWNEWSPALSLDNRPFWGQGTLFRGREPFWGEEGALF